ncbi:MAG: hypothetical protein CVU23_12855 [Betaproteobacteria bacterium HGW-Betaproteobacteria-17]|nr:MAG: hypothetical protein CVU23_12855 [Betaproteobacteria bacterium HGW-Betaproteobacteria-17]PKO82760.1 MAG: hypothetical protein CVU17_11790 [Betaproteobacteria bacterium HGW-Betaproteobacteria-11]
MEMPLACTITALLAMLAVVVLLRMASPTPTPMPTLLLGLVAAPMPEAVMPTVLVAPMAIAPATLTVTPSSRAVTTSCAAAIPAAAAMVTFAPSLLPSWSRWLSLVLSSESAVVEVPPVLSFFFSSLSLKSPPPAVAVAFAS